MIINKSEKGQVIVVLAIALLVLLAFAALGVDGSHIYAERSRAQAASDSTALAAALAGSQGGNWNSAGLLQAAKNGFNNDGTTNTVTISHPPVSGAYVGLSQYYQVKIMTKIKPVFASLIFSNGLTNTVETFTRVTSGVLSDGNSLVATNPSTDCAIKNTGSGSIIVENGGVFSNSNNTKSLCSTGSGSGLTLHNSSAKIAGGLNLTGSGNVVINTGNLYSAGQLKSTGSGGVDVNGGAIYLLNTVNKTGSGTITADGGIFQNQPSPVVSQQTWADLATPNCNSLPTRSADFTCSADHTIDPGYYPDGINQAGSGDLTLHPGLYCLDDDLKLSGSGSITGNGVMFYIRNESDFLQTGSGSIHLTAPTNLVDASGNQWSGMLIYMNPSFATTVKITGSGNMLYTGSIWAKNSECTVSGSGSSNGLHSQVICSTIELNGSGNITVLYNASDNFGGSAVIDLIQ
jgi:hypothetical protein